jgi:hypothetical protein
MDFAPTQAVAACDGDADKPRSPAATLSRAIDECSVSIDECATDRTAIGAQFSSTSATKVRGRAHHGERQHRNV